MKKIIKIIITLYNKIRFLKKCKIYLGSLVYGKVLFEGANIICPKTIFNSSKIGYASYIGMNCVFYNAKIGRFCSIGNNIKIVSGTHPTNFVSTHPAFYSPNRKKITFVNDLKFKENLQRDNGNSIIIGNDVWIGDNVLIKGGVKIGDGAIIGMGAVVTKDVPPYAVVAGVPAKIIKFRFTEDQVQFLLDFQWWNRDMLWLKDNVNVFCNIENFIKGIKGKNNESL